jgi:hypothetical protein
MSGIGSPQTVKGARGGEPAETPDIRSGATFRGPHVCAMGANADVPLTPRAAAIAGKLN